MFRRLARLMLLLWSVCAVLAFGAGVVGGLLPGHQLLHSTHDRESFQRQITLVDVEHGLSLPIIINPASDFALSSRGLITLTGEGTSIIALDLYSSQRRLLVPNTATYDTGTFDAAWSPDGTTLAFIAADQSRYRLSQRIYLSAGSTLRNLMPERSYRAIRELVWSPDGTRIAFTGHESNNSPAAIYVVDVSSRAIYKLSPVEIGASQPAWSPDSAFIAFRGEQQGISDIYLMNADGSEPRNLTLTRAHDAAPVWSPDGTRIAFASQASGNLDIYIMETSGSQRRRLTYHSRNSLSPSWSPDGMYIAFVFEGFNGYEIHVVGADGSGERRISYAGVAGSTPLWLP